MTEIYLSTGAFIGRKNGRNHRLLLDYQEKIECDGFEFMFFSSWYEIIDVIKRDYKSNNVNIPIVHTDKSIGNLFSSNVKSDIAKSYDLMKINCEHAADLNAKSLVLHIWGMPYSDTHEEEVYKRVAKMQEIAAQYNLKILVENIFVTQKTPLYHVMNLKELYPNIGFTIDTRCAQFYKQLPQTCKSDIWDENVGHIHINDYKGGYMDWNSMHPILQPGLGDVDFTSFFEFLRSIKYNKSITLEAPSIKESVVDYKTLNNSLNFIKESCRK